VLARTPELLMRWTELNAFTAVFSYPSHRGFARCASRKKAKRADEHQSDSFTLSSAHGWPYACGCACECKRIGGARP
jgi:hypothetical protein